MLDTFAHWVVKYRWLVVALTLAITAVLVAQIRNMQIVIDPNAALPQHHPYVIGTNLAERVFGSNYTLVVAVVPERGDIYRSDVLERVKRISEALVDIPGVKKDTLMSLAARRAKDIRGHNDGLDITPLMEQVPSSAAELARLKRAIASNPVYQHTIVARDGTAAAVTVSVEKGPNGFRPILAEVYRTIAPLETAGIHIAVSGTPMYISWVETYAQRMLLFFPLALVIVGLLHFEAFRSLQGLLLPLTTAFLSVLWGLGLMGLAKVPMDAFNALTPILILAVAAGHAVQLLKRYYEEYDRLAQHGVEPTDANRQAVIASLVRVGPVMLAAGGVAVAGFLSLVTFHIDTIRNFGVFTGLGILSGLLIEMTFIPALRSWMKPPKAATSSPRRIRLWDRIAEHVAAATTGPSRVPVYAAALAAAILLGLGVQWLNLENSYKSYFAADLPFQNDDRLINRRLGGTNTLYVTVEGAHEDAIKDPAVLRFIDATQRFIETQDGVGKTISLADLVKRMHQAMSGDDARAYVIPGDRDLISQYLLLYSMSGEPGDFDTYVDYQYRHAIITAFLKNDSSLYIHGLIDRITQFTHAQQNPGVRIHFGGSVPQSSALADVLVPGKLRNIAQMALVVFAVSALIFRSVVAGLLVLAPLAITVFANFGVMGLTGIPLNTPNAISSAMAIGIGADYAIYLLYRIKEEFAVHGELQAAVRSAVATAGKAVLFVGSAIAAGYSVLLLSYGFYVHIWFGILIVLSMIVSMIASLYLVPALVMSLRARFITHAASGRGRVSRSAAAAAAAAALVCALAAYHGDACADTLSAVQVMERNFAASKFDDSVSEATIKLVNKNGDARTRKTYGVTKLETNGIDTKRMTRFLSPADIRNTVTVLIEHADRDDEIWIYLPALKKVRRLAAANKKDSWAGTDLSYGDVIGYKVQDWNHALTRTDTLDGRRVYVVESTPKTPETAAHSGYSKRVNWIDTESFVAAKTELYDASGQLAKTVVAADVRKLEGKKGGWQPMHVMVRQHHTGHQTLIDFDRFAIGQGVRDEFFTPRYMEKEK